MFFYSDADQDPHFLCGYVFETDVTIRPDRN